MRPCTTGVPCLSGVAGGNVGEDAVEALRQLVNSQNDNIATLERKLEQVQRRLEFREKHNLEESNLNQQQFDSIFEKLRHRPEIEDVNRSLDSMVSLLEEKILDATKNLVSSDVVEDKLLDFQIQFDERALLLARGTTGVSTSSPSTAQAAEEQLSALLALPTASDKLCSCILSGEDPISKHLHALAYQASSADENVARLVRWRREEDAPRFSALEARLAEAEQEILRLAADAEGAAGGVSNYDHWGLLGAARDLSSNLKVAEEDREHGNNAVARRVHTSTNMDGPPGGTSSNLEASATSSGGERRCALANNRGGSEGDDGAVPSTSSPRLRRLSSLSQAVAELRDGSTRRGHVRSAASSNVGAVVSVAELDARIEESWRTQSEILRAEVSARYDILCSKFQLLSQQVWPDSVRDSSQSPARVSSKIHHPNTPDERARAEQGGNGPCAAAGAGGGASRAASACSARGGTRKTGVVLEEQSEAGPSSVAAALPPNIRRSDLVTKDQFLALTALVESKVSLSDLHARVSALVKRKLTHSTQSSCSPGSASSSSTASTRDTPEVPRQKRTVGVACSASTADAPASTGSTNIKEVIAASSRDESEERTAASERNIDDATKSLVQQIGTTEGGGQEENCSSLTAFAQKFPDLYDLDNEEGDLAGLYRNLPSVIQKHLDVGNYVPGDLIDEHVEKKTVAAEVRLRAALEALLERRMQDLGGSMQQELAELFLRETSGMRERIDSMLQDEQLSLPRRIARYVWRGTDAERLCVEKIGDEQQSVSSSGTKSMSTSVPASELLIPWEIELGNTASTVFERGCGGDDIREILVKEAGLYLITTAFFGGHSPRLQVFLNERAQLERHLDCEEAQEATGVSISEYFVIEAQGKIGVRFSCHLRPEDEFPPEGFLELQKL
ncbi:unnamed protein product [Amoebophrya sp. A25]|nr:unnamed protein product [Amoebophrya sp. A25]|eukprot:GSA25T00006315001.1